MLSYVHAFFIQELKGVLILGRFSDPARKAVPDGLREKLRLFDLLPMVFDFDTPNDKDYTDTVQTLAGMSMFVVADLTSPKSTPMELKATVKQFKIPYVPIIDTSVDNGLLKWAPVLPIGIWQLHSRSRVSDERSLISRVPVGTRRWL